MTFAVALVGALLASAVLSLRARGWTAGAVARGRRAGDGGGSGRPAPGGRTAFPRRPVSPSCREASRPGSTPVADAPCWKPRLGDDAAGRQRYARAVPQPDAGDLARELLRRGSLRDVAAAKRDRSSRGRHRRADTGRGGCHGTYRRQQTVEHRNRLGSHDRTRRRLHQAASGAVRENSCPAAKCWADWWTGSSASRATSQGSDDPGCSSWVRRGSRTSSASRSPMTPSCAIPCAGGRVLVVQTNNATCMAAPAQPAQRVAMSQLRAVEHGRGYWWLPPAESPRSCPQTAA